MSETNTPTPPGEGAPAPAPYVPQDALGMEDSDDATKPLQSPPQRDQPAGEATDGGDKAEAPAETEEERQKSERRREASRIGYLTKQRYAEKARADALEERLRIYEAQQNGSGGQALPELSPEQQQKLAQWVDQRAAEKLSEQQASERFSQWDATGVKEFGQEKFRDACKTVAEMASDQQRQILREVAMDTDGGARAIIEMAGDAEVAERILSLPPHRMALEIAKLGAPKTLAPKAVSNAPPPIRPPSVGRARGEPDPEGGDMETFMRWSQKQAWRR